MFIQIGKNRYINLANVQSMTTHDRRIIFFCNHSFLKNPNQGFRSQQALFRIDSDNFSDE